MLPPFNRIIYIASLCRKGLYGFFSSTYDKVFFLEGLPCCLLASYHTHHITPSLRPENRRSRFESFFQKYISTRDCARITNHVFGGFLWTPRLAM
jgi:hypothetical protein